MKQERPSITLTFSTAVWPPCWRSPKKVRQSILAWSQRRLHWRRPDIQIRIAPCRVMTQVPCEALRVEGEPLLAELNRGGKLQQLLLRYTHVLKDGVGVRRRSACPSTACRQRPCRWLLVTSDCLQSDSLGLAPKSIWRSCSASTATASARSPSS